MPRVAFPLLSLLLALPGWATERAPSPERSAPAVMKSYPARGVIRELNLPAKRALIAHEAISGYMAAMTMEFSVPNESELRTLQPGDPVTFRLCVTDEHGWIDQLRKVAGPASAPPALHPLPAPIAVRVGDPLPDCELIDERGQVRKLSEFRGRVLAITFIFTRCPFPDYCPLMNRQFSVVQSALTASHPLERWQLLSISIDPEYDTPERLASYAQQGKFGGPSWAFATGKTDDIAQLGSSLGIVVTRPGQALNHTLRTVIVDPAGRVQRILTGNEWRPADLIEEMRSEMPVRAQ